MCVCNVATKYLLIIYADVSHLQLPPKMKRRGCLKGAELIIGLPKKNEF